MKKNMLLALCSIFFALVALEITLRLITHQPVPPSGPKTNWAIVPERVWTEYHPDLGWYHQKNKKAFLRKNGFEIEVNTNSQGFRGSREYSIEKPKGVKRILVLGDSFVFGWGVRDHETFCSKLEQQYKNWEAIDLGVAGFGIDQILMSYRSIGQKFKPDVVVISIFPEDFWRATRTFSDSGYAKPYFSLTPSGDLELNNVPVPKPFELRYNQFPEIIQQNSLEKLLIQSLVYRKLKLALIRLGKNLGWVDPDSTGEWILGRAILNQLVREIQQNNAKPILLVIPPHRWFLRKNYESIHKSILRLAKREGFELIDATEPFREAINRSSLEDYYIKDDWHWTEKGHELVSKLITERIKKMELQ